jgi:hypothetical protein
MSYSLLILQFGTVQIWKTTATPATTAFTGNPQNIKDKHDDHLPKNSAALCPFHVLRLFNCRVWKQLIFEMCVYSKCFM